MKKFILFHGQFILNLLVILSMATYAKAQSGIIESSPSVREHLLMNSGWRFALGNSCDPSGDFGIGTSYFSYFAKAGGHDGEIEGESYNFDDRAWRIVDLPHDWAVELPFDSTGSSSHGYKSLGKNFLEQASDGIENLSSFLNRISANGLVSSSMGYSEIPRSGSTGSISANITAVTRASSMISPTT